MSCNWDIVKAMRNEMEKYHSSVNRFRSKILAAMCQMQSAMGLKDLGRFYIKPLQDSQGTVVFSCTNYIKVSAGQRPPFFLAYPRQSILSFLRIPKVFPF